MKLIKISQSGFGLVTLVFVLLFISVVGFAGYKVVTGNVAGIATKSDGLNVIEIPATISTQADLEATVKALDGSDAKVQSSMDDSELDADLNDML